MVEDDFMAHCFILSNYSISSPFLRLLPLPLAGEGRGEGIFYNIEDKKRTFNAAKIKDCLTKKKTSCLEGLEEEWSGFVIALKRFPVKGISQNQCCHSM